MGRKIERRQIAVGKERMQETRLRKRPSTGWPKARNENQKQFERGRKRGR
jgi:hypothetical protein